MSRVPWLGTLLAAWLCTSLCVPVWGEAPLETPQWIWFPRHKQGKVPQGPCYFRKEIYLQVEHRGRLDIAADDVYEAYINGKKVAVGGAHDRLVSYDITSALKEGNNLIAIKVTNRNGGTAGLAAQIYVECDAIPARRFITNPTWKTSTGALPLWTTSNYRDQRWEPAEVLGKYDPDEPSATRSYFEKSKTQKEVPADRLAAQDDGRANAEHPSFRLPEDFEIQFITGQDKTGSLIALTFDEFGRILASREGGPLLCIVDSNDNGVPDDVRTCCDQVQSCQGILALNGRVFVIGDGPDGVALYRLEDTNRDGTYEQVDPILEFEGTLGEQGPHGLVLGPDGLIYVAIGNHTKAKQPYDANSPHRNFYEGDLVARYEDPLGHDAGIKVPGGGVIRLDAEGQQVELVAGGLRNAYDLAFNHEGELFMHDSDMESDAGTTWERPTRLLHILPGGEYGWRSGWSRWPEYWLDNLPAVLETGRGSPAGCTFYDHTAYPAKYQHTFFSCDWAEGKIVSIRLQREGAGYSAVSETFLEGRPLNVTDIEVGPEGSLYFTTGGRGTQGNLYRVVYKKAPPAEPNTLPGIVPAVRQPQSQSAWARQFISTRRRDLGGQWDFEIRAFVKDRSQDAAARAKAVTAMHLVGPPPTDAELAYLAEDPSPLIRAKAAFLAGLIRSELAQTALARLLLDPEPVVRRRAAESLARNQSPVTFAQLQPLLAAPDRFEHTAARRLLESQPLSTWEPEVFATDQPAVFCQAAMAALIAAPSKELALRIVDRAATISEPIKKDQAMLPILRVVQLAKERGPLAADDVPLVGKWLAQKFPYRDARLNRELTRLLVPLQDHDALDRMLAYMESSAAQAERLHVALQLRFLKDGWTPQQKARLLTFYERASAWEPSSNLGGYVDQVAEDFLMTCTAAERQAILDQGDRMPNMALASLFQMSESEDDANVQRLIALDRKLPASLDPPMRDLKVGILAILARSGDEPAMAYLREVYDRYPDRRSAAAMGLAQFPGGRNWDYLVRAIPLLEDEPAKEVLTRLRTVDEAPQEIEHYRQVILCGLRLQENGGLLAVQLLEHWVGRKPDDAGDRWDTALPAWQRWFQQTHPKQPEPSLPQEKGQNTWTQTDLETFLSSRQGTEGSAAKGKLVYEKAQCAKCHVHGQLGENFGPPLTTLASRFQKKEILEAILFPSQVIPDRFAAYQFEMQDGRTLLGQVLPEADNKFRVIQSDGTSQVIAESDIKNIHPSKTSPMPEGLLNSLTLEEIADLFAFLLEEPPTDVARKP